jgi:membrane associated rhomboid family serine protease
MLIIPIVGNISWRNPPYVTILLILINCFVYFAFQFDEGPKMMAVYSQYFDTGLSDIEIPQYISFIENKEGATDLVSEYYKLQDEEKFEPPPENDPDGVNSISMIEMQILMTMENDSDFMNTLYQGNIITGTNEEYPRWKTLRTEFDEKKDTLMSYKFGMTPARIKPYSFLTCMFLHGGLGHLIGNMIFLWIVGCMLEMGCGRIVYGVGYLMVGLCASLFFFLVHSDSYVPMIGASGAISGLMGALTVLYGLSRIKVFFSTGFYFDSFNIPAIALLPFWVGTEFFQYYFSANEQVAYMAHAGGLLGGALLGVVAKMFFSQTQKTFFEEQPQDRSPALLEEALSRIGRLDYAGARTMLLDFLALKPESIEALEHLFNIDKLRPLDSGFSKTASRLLSVLITKRMDADRIWKTFSEYEKFLSSADLPVDLQIRLAFLFCDRNHLDDAEKLICSLLQKKPDHPNLSTLLLRLIKGFDKSGSSSKSQSYQKILLEKFPMSPEARLAG